MQICPFVLSPPILKQPTNQQLCIQEQFLFVCVSCFASCCLKRVVLCALMFDSFCHFSNSYLERLC